MTSLSREAAQSIKREFLLPVDQAKRLQSLAESRHISESRVVEKALEVFFSLTDVFDQDTDRQVWYRLSEPALLRVWDNDPDAAYDNRLESGQSSISLGLQADPLHPRTLAYCPPSRSPQCL